MTDEHDVIIEALDCTVLVTRIRVNAPLEDAERHVDRSMNRAFLQAMILRASVHEQGPLSNRGLGLGRPQADEVTARLRKEVVDRQPGRPVSCRDPAPVWARTKAGGRRSCKDCMLWGLPETGRTRAHHPPASLQARAAQPDWITGETPSQCQPDPCGVRQGILDRKPCLYSLGAQALRFVGGHVEAPSF